PAGHLPRRPVRVPRHDDDHQRLVAGGAVLVDAAGPAGELDVPDADRPGGDGRRGGWNGLRDELLVLLEGAVEGAGLFEGGAGFEQLAVAGPQFRRDQVVPLVRLAAGRQEAGDRNQETERSGHENRPSVPWSPARCSALVPHPAVGPPQPWSASVGWDEALRSPTTPPTAP